MLSQQTKCLGINYLLFLSPWTSGLRSSQKTQIYPIIPSGATCQCNILSSPNHLGYSYCSVWPRLFCLFPTARTLASSAFLLAMCPKDPWTSAFLKSAGNLGTGSIFLVLSPWIQKETKGSTRSGDIAVSVRGLGIQDDSITEPIPGNPESRMKTLMDNRLLRHNSCQKMDITVFINRGIKTSQGKWCLSSVHQFLIMQYFLCKW